MNKIAFHDLFPQYISHDIINITFTYSFELNYANFFDFNSIHMQLNKKDIRRLISTNYKNNDVINDFLKFTEKVDEPIYIANEHFYDTLSYAYNHNNYELTLYIEKTSRLLMKKLDEIGQHVLMFNHNLIGLHDSYVHNNIQIKANKKKLNIITLNITFQEFLQKTILNRHKSYINLTKGSIYYDRSIINEINNCKNHLIRCNEVNHYLNSQELITNIQTMYLCYAKIIVKKMEKDEKNIKYSICFYNRELPTIITKNSCYLLLSKINIHKYDDRIKIHLYGDSLYEYVDIKDIINTLISCYDEEYIKKYENESIDLLYTRNFIRYEHINEEKRKLTFYETIISDETKKACKQILMNNKNNHILKTNYNDKTINSFMKARYLYLFNIILIDYSNETYRYLSLLSRSKLYKNNKFKEVFNTKKKLNTVTHYLIKVNKNACDKINCCFN